MEFHNFAQSVKGCFRRKTHPILSGTAVTSKDTPMDKILVKAIVKLFDRVETMIEYTDEGRA